MHAEDYGSLSALIKAIRSTYQISQRQMGERLGVSAGYIGQWELALGQPSVDLTEKLCEVFGLSDQEYVHRLVYAAKAPPWLRESILIRSETLSKRGKRRRIEERLLRTIRELSLENLLVLEARIEGWVDGIKSVGKHQD